MQLPLIRVGLQWDQSLLIASQETVPQSTHLFVHQANGREKEVWWKPEIAQEERMDLINRVRLPESTVVKFQKHFLERKPVKHIPFLER